MSVVCAGCAIDRAQPVAAPSGRPRVPAGWKRLRGQWWCPTCKRARFVLRAIALPVSGPRDGTWPDLRAALHEAFGETTRCANWLVTELYARDHARRPDDERLPKMPAVYLYPEARVRFPSLAPQTLASLEQQVQARYRAARLDLVWRHAVSLPTYRYPMPLPLPSRMWELTQHDQRWQISVRIGDRRWTLALRQGPGMRRQMRVLEQVAAGAADAGEATLYEIAAHRGDHRAPSARDRRLMVKLAVWLARRDAMTPRDMTAAPLAARAAGPIAVDTLIVRTVPHAFVTAHVAGHDDDVWTLNADHVRRWIAEAARRRQRLQEDAAQLARVADDGRVGQGGHGGKGGDSGRSRAAIRAGADIVERRLSDRVRRQVHNWTHEATAQLVACARRRRVTAIAWDDRVGGYMPSYPWHRFVTTLTDKAAAAGISVTTIRPSG